MLSSVRCAASARRQLSRSSSVLNAARNAPQSANGNGALMAGLAGGLFAGVAAYLYKKPSTSDTHAGHGPGKASPATAATGHAEHRVENKPVPKAASVNYQAVARDVADLLEADAAFDENQGHCGPILVRLAWHASGTYNAYTKTGGSDGATMRFEPESAHGANKGLKIARDHLEPIKKKYGDALSYGDLWTLAGVVAIQEMGGPVIPWRPGRLDKKDCITPDGLLPDATKGADHLRDIFRRLSFNDQEIVALSGAHALGKCHPDRSGFTGPWTRAPTTFSNMYYTELLNQDWVPKKTDKVKDASGKVKTVPWKGPLQYTDKATQELMMLPSDMTLVRDPEFRPHVERYAADSEAFFADFSRAFEKLIHLGVNQDCLNHPPINLLQ